MSISFGRSHLVRSFHFVSLSFSYQSHSLLSLSLSPRSLFLFVFSLVVITANFMRPWQIRGLFLFFAVLNCCTQLASSSYLCVRHLQNSPSSVRHHVVNCNERRLDRRDTNSTSAIVVDFTCRASDQECDQANKTFTTASQLLSSVLRLETPIRVNASYLSFCDNFDDCGVRYNNGTLNIGQAYPTVSYLMTDPTDNMTRMYPQAVLKQYTHQLPGQPEWTTYDISAQFNSDVQWYFEDNDATMDDNHLDFLRTVMHEFVHGLGFVSAWSDKEYWRFERFASSYVKPFLTPMPLDPPNELSGVSLSADSDEGVQPYYGYVEFPLDRFLHATQTNLAFSEVTAALNAWGDANIMFQSMVDMVNAWCAQPDLAAQAETVYNASTQPRGVYAILPDVDDILLLETTFSPFSSGTTLSHVDHATYSTTGDYLMIYDSPRGVTFDAMVARYSVPLGPLLVRTLASFGYALQDGYNGTTLRPRLSFWDPPSDLVGTTSNPSPAVSIHADGPASIPSSSSLSASSSTSSTPSRRSFSGYVAFTLLLAFAIIILLL